MLALVSVDIDVARDMPIVFGDRRRLCEVWENLIGNAVKFVGTQPHPRVTVGVRHAGSPSPEREWTFFIRDNGFGIDPHYHDRIFTLFEKLDPHSEGTGIGLTIARRIVENHGGRIWAESEGVGHGSTFCFTLVRGPTGTDIGGQS